MLPTERIVVTVLCNAMSEWVYGLHEDVVASLLPAYAGRLAAKRAEGRQTPAAAEPFRPPRGMSGAWVGAIHTYDGDLPFELTFGRNGETHARIGDQLTALVNKTNIEHGYLRGKFVGELGTTDAARHPYHVALDLKLRGSRLNGCVLSVPSSRSEGGSAGRRVGNTLACWTELRRK
jgi:hypothetical protein